MSEAMAQEPGTSTVPCQDIETTDPDGVFRNRICGKKDCPWKNHNGSTLSGTCTIKNTGPSISF